MAEEKKTYEQAVQELNALVKKIEDPNVSFTDLESGLKRAMELIKFCKEELQGYKEKFDNIK
ncbi:MAG: exodeoxyribonuclease VII small subunit [Bacteroidales bacterium]|jgi:exodeoxyribonuclease VII small subunit|nr:exodeoxyribonuclease VII small subunit [Bacteroidales bacterium]MDD3911258.1 exodeoxyribonuclease VII small subunit [Bacteroidales bacterium]MDD4420449.1 exodeoxyribonuclease VII small subunit [Bacteroidales bacterium]